MTTLRFEGRFKADKLLDEINAVPALTGLIPTLQHYTQTDPEYVEIDLPDGTDPDLVETIVRNHNPDEPSLGELADQRQAAARSHARNIPGWARYDEQQLLNAISGRWDATTINSIASVADARVVILNMAQDMQHLARLVIALRDETWSGLP